MNDVSDLIDRRERSAQRWELAMGLMAAACLLAMHLGWI